MILLTLSVLFLTVYANSCGQVSSAPPGQKYPVRWPFLEITENGEIGVLVNFGNNMLSSPSNNSISNHPARNKNSGFGAVSVENAYNFQESVCLDKVDISLYSNSTQCVVVTLSEDRKTTITSPITLYDPEDNQECMNELIATLYSDEELAVAKRYAKRHFCLSSNVNQNGFTPFLCYRETSGIGNQWNLVGYAGLEFQASESKFSLIGNTIKNDLTAAWLSDVVSLPIGSTSTIPFDVLYSVCCETINLENDLPSDGVYTKTDSKCDSNPWENQITQFQNKSGHEYGFGLVKRLMQRNDKLWDIYVVELNFFKYFFVVPGNCDENIDLTQNGVIYSNDNFVDSACIESESEKGFYFNQAVTGVKLQVKCVNNTDDTNDTNPPITGSTITATTDQVLNITTEQNVFSTAVSNQTESATTSKTIFTNLGMTLLVFSLF